MTLEILTPDKKVFEGEVTSVTVPGTMGSFQILRDHAPIISTLEDGPVIIKTKSTEDTFIIKGDAFLRHAEVGVKHGHIKAYFVKVDIAPNGWRSGSTGYFKRPGDVARGIS